MSQTTLTTGDLFLLEASGTASVGSRWVDAEYGATGANGTGDDAIAGTDVGVDVGFKIERVAKGATATRKKWFGDVRSDHTYYVLVTGAGAPLSVKLLLPAGMASPSSDTITVSLVRLSPMAPALSPLDSIKVPIIKQIVSSTFVPATGSVYLLQAAGSGKAGGANLGLGDADWMDWNADGVGKLDIGDNNVDYGIGVDESNTAQTPRQRWWGPWRKDHIYYQLFAGTGNRFSSCTTTLDTGTIRPPRNSRCKFSRFPESVHCTTRSYTADALFAVNRLSRTTAVIAWCPTDRPLTS